MSSSFNCGVDKILEVLELLLINLINLTSKILILVKWLPVVNCRLYMKMAYIFTILLIGN